MFVELKDLFEAIADAEYVVLRNYEEFDGLHFLENHPDIDILCRKPEALVEALALRPRRRREDGIHYYVMLKDTRVSVDLRHVGDGYLDALWEDAILRERVNYRNFYVMDAENYFYSLLYHVIVQKHTVTQDYASRLAEMAEQEGIPFGMEEKESVLDAFMERRGYRYTYPKFVGTIFNTKNVRQDLVEKNKAMQIKRGGYAALKKMLGR